MIKQEVFILMHKQKNKIHQHKKTKPEITTMPQTKPNEALISTGKISFKKNKLNNPIKRRKTTYNPKKEKTSIQILKYLYLMPYPELQK